MLNRNSFNAVTVSRNNDSPPPILFQLRNRDKFPGSKIVCGGSQIVTVPKFGGITADRSCRGAGLAIGTKRISMRKACHRSTSSQTANLTDCELTQ
jgi:hypothetical protein